MKILGISNPSFTGVTLATKAHCTDWYGVASATAPGQAQLIAETAFKANPDLLIIGGWSPGYEAMLRELKRVKHFPVLGIYHSTLFHGESFADDVNWVQFEKAYRDGLMDLIGFVQPQTAEYYQKIRDSFAVFVPHSFKLKRPRAKKMATFKIGCFGGRTSWFKNTGGSIQVAKDFGRKHQNVEVVAPVMYDRPHEAFLSTISTCSCLIHVSHLECYSNTIQEAWMQGVPVITSSSSDGLINKNPLLPPSLKRGFSELQVTSNIDAMELYHKLEDVYTNWQAHSDFVCMAYSELAARTEIYTRALFTRIVNDYQDRVHDVAFFESPFTKEGIPWDHL